MTEQSYEFPSGWDVAASCGQIGLADDEVRLVEHDPVWAELFLSFRGELLVVLPSARIEHVGSTSVEACISKPLIDISIGLPSDDSFDVSVADRFHLYFRAVNPESTLFALYGLNLKRLANIHVRPRDSSWELWDLKFRDYLRSDSEQAGDYNQAKLRAQRLASDRGSYSAAKAEFFHRQYSAIESWAQSSAWKPTEF